MNISVGSLVRARGREWVVLPESTEYVLRLRPLDGGEAETTAVLTSVEAVEPAKFGLPDPSQLGDLSSARLLRDAVRLGFRSGAGPFRCLAGLGFEPRSYQLVPLLMALRLDPVRLLIADDVGIGKTVEAGLIAKELLARGEITRLCVLCPPHLAEQWQAELDEKFGVAAELVLPSTVARLERRCAPGESVFERFPATIVSLDYIKQERRRADFLRACPEFVIVDEAHTCTQAGAGARQQRYRLVKELSENSARHLVLVTATPHSGNEDAFRSLLSLLKPEFGQLPEDLTPESRRREREALARHFVQRRRADIRTYLQENTPFPERKEKDATYRLHPEYRDFLFRALEYGREVVADQSGTKFQQRIRWWSALALLRSISSSPAAAAATLRARAGQADLTSEEEADEFGRRITFDLVDEQTAEGSTDIAPGADFLDDGSPNRRRLLEMARQAENLRGDKDAKLRQLVEVVRDLVEDKFSPVVFCRFIPTAEYVAEELRARLKGVEVACVTGQLPHDEREQRVLELAGGPKRVLVCTDCLSEGINLQEHFDAAVHADLAWSPTRHEQREGRVDRFNQRSPEVRVVTYYGEDNPIDGVVLDILLRKHKTIRSSLGVSVPVPSDFEKVAEAVFEALMMKGGTLRDGQYRLFDELFSADHKRLEVEWQNAADKEKRSRTLFAQHTIKPVELEPELQAARAALGSPQDVERFVRTALRAYGATVGDGDPFDVDLSRAPASLREALFGDDPIGRGRNKGDRFRATFLNPAPRDAVPLSRCRPFVRSLAGCVLDAALAGDPDARAARCAVIGTNDVQQRTCLFLLRCRYQLEGARGEILAEDVAVAAFAGSPENPRWLPEADAERLLDARPARNVPSDRARALLEKLLDQFPVLDRPLREIAEMRADRLLEAHRRVRRALDQAGAARAVRAQGRPDVLGVYLLLPAGAGQ